MFSRSLTQSLRLRGLALAAPSRRSALLAARGPARSYSAVRGTAVQYSSARAVSAATSAGRVPYWRAYSTEEEVKEVAEEAPQEETPQEETVSGEEPRREREGQTGGPFRVMVKGVPTEAMNRDVRVFLSRAGHVCWIRRVRPEQNDGEGLVIVEYLTEDEARTAIDTLNGEEIDGDAVQVEPDTSGLTMELPSRLMIKNLPYTYDEFQVRELVAGYDVSWVNMINNDRGFSGMATVKFSSQEQAKEAMTNLVNAEADGRRLIPSFQGASKRTSDGGNRGGPRRRWNDHSAPRGGGGGGGYRGDRNGDDGGFRRRDNQTGSRAYDNSHFEERRGGQGRYNNNNRGNYFE